MDKIDAGEWGDEVEDGLKTTLANAVDDFGPDFDAEGLPLEEGESERVISSGAAAAATDRDR